MNAKHIRWIILLMAFCLIGLVGIQFYWIRHAVHLQEAQFRDTVNSALMDLVQEIDEEKVVSGSFEQGEELNIRRTKIITKDSGSLELKMIAIETDSSNRPQHVQGDSGTWNTEKVLAIRKVIIQDEKTETEDQEIRIGASGPPDQKALDALLSKTLKEHGITMDFEAEFMFPPDPQAGQKSFEFIEVSEDKKEGFFFRTSLPGSQTNSGPGELMLWFPGEDQGLLKQMGMVLSTSGLIILLIIGGFSFTLMAFFKMKKLSELKTDLINNMTHELKTPISTISLASEALLDPQSKLEDKQVRSFAQIIRDENQRLRARVESVLEMARMDRGELKLNRSQHNLHDLISAETDRFKAQVEQRKGKLELVLDARESLVDVDEVHFSGIISNLLDNALKYSPEVPSIHIKTSSDPKHFSLWISDKGQGISKEQQKKIFEPFYRVPKGNLHDVKGFGVGLSYAKAMVEAHGGSIKVESELGKGTVFELQFPLDKKAHE